MFLGLPYRMSPKVVRAEKNRALSWRMPTGHYWTWEIADNHDGTVTVRETWDASEAKIFGFIPLRRYSVGLVCSRVTAVILGCRWRN